MVRARLYGFMLTWFLHADQWFWLRGTMWFVVQDILFWAILGVFVVMNALYELKYGRNRALGNATQTWRSLGMTTLKTFATFWFICILWSFWTTESLSTWFSLWSALDGPWTINVLFFPAVVLAVILLGNIQGSKLRNVRSTKTTSRDWIRARFGMLATMLVL